MLSSIHPFGERSRNSRWWLTISSYLFGSVAGGITMGAIAGVVGLGVRQVVGTHVALLILGIAGLIGLAADLGLGGLRVPGIHRQVNERWLTQYRGWVYGIGFGFQLGLGVVTIVTTSLVWITWLAAMLTGSLASAMLIGAAFGLARGSFIFSTAGVDQPEQLRSLHRSIEHHAATVHRITVAAALALAAATSAAGILTISGAV